MRLQLSLLVLSLALAEEAEVEPSGRTGPARHRDLAIVFENQSKYRADIHWHDGRFGRAIGTLDPGKTTSVRTMAGHTFFVTRHGVREQLVDPSTDERITFRVQEDSKTFVIPANAATPADPCTDRFDICKAEAERTHCMDSPGWMVVHCCESCDPYIQSRSLIDPKVRCTREKLNTTSTQALGPGDLNRLFERWVQDPSTAELGLEVLASPGGKHGGKNGPWVVVFNSFLTEYEADALVEGGRREGFQRSTDQGKVNAAGEQEKVVSRSRTSSNAWCLSKCQRTPGVSDVTAKIERVTGIPEGNYESFQILEYQPGQFYKTHHDSTKRVVNPAGQRILTFFLYLNDVEEGGETYFPQLGLSVAAEKGKALVWPSVDDANPDLWDRRTYHEAKPVVKGVKYAANHWIHNYSYRVPNRWGCTGSFT